MRKNVIKIISYLMNETFLQMVKHHNDICSKKKNIRKYKRLRNYLDTANNHVLNT